MRSTRLGIPALTLLHVGLAATTVPMASGSEPAGEAWFATFAQGQRIGSRHVVTRAVQVDGKDAVEHASRERLLVHRGADTVDIEIRISSRHRKDGSLIDAQYNLPLGGEDRQVRARPEGDALVLRALDSGAELKRLPWTPETGGPFAETISVLAEPMEPGERRSLKMFVPPLEEVVDVELLARDWEPTPLLDGTFRLLRIESQVRLKNGASFSATWWTDPFGRSQKLEQAAGIVVTSYRTSRRVAESRMQAARLDLFAASLIPLDEKLADPHNSSRIEFEFELPAENGVAAGSLFVRDGRQEVVQISPTRGRLAVKRSPDSRGAVPQPVPDDKPLPADLASTQFVERDNAAILEAARQVDVGDRGDRALAVALERHVHARIREKSYGKVFSSAAEVLRSREGDCTEHTVLLVALCRARGLPARGVMGLVYSKPHSALAYHMWTEVWVEETWLPLDATLGQGCVGPTHIKIGHSRLDGPASLADVLVFLQHARGIRMQIRHIDGESPAPVPE